MKLRAFFIIPVLTLLINSTLFAQSVKVSDKSKVMIEGTSTMHDWESEVTNVSGSGSILLDNATIKEINSLDLTFVVKSIKSDKSKMNNLTYEALKEENHPNITLKLTKATISADNTIQAQGSLTIAGKSQNVNLSGKGAVSGSTITITGEYELDMTAYGVEPPSLMFGSIQVDKMVKIKYNLILN